MTALPPSVIEELDKLPKDGRLFHILMTLNDLVNKMVSEPDPYTLNKIIFLKMVGEF